MKSELLRAVGSVLSRVASIGDALVGYTRSLADACARYSPRPTIECPYCQERIRTVEDHVVWCDLVDSLKAPLADPATKWPIVRFGYGINREQAEDLSRESK